MDAKQIKVLIDQKIAGQGNQVDSGGALSTILNAIVDAVAEAPIAQLENLTPYDEIMGVDYDDDAALAAALGISVDDLSALRAGKVNTVKDTNGDMYNVFVSNAREVTAFGRVEGAEILLVWCIDAISIEEY